MFTISQTIQLQLALFFSFESASVGTSFIFFVSSPETGSEKEYLRSRRGRSWGVGGTGVPAGYSSRDRSGRRLRHLLWFV